MGRRPGREKCLSTLASTIADRLPLCFKSKNQPGSVNNPVEGFEVKQGSCRVFFFSLSLSQSNPALCGVTFLYSHMSGLRMCFIASSNTALLCCLIIEVSKSFSGVSDWQWGRAAPLRLPDFLVRDDMTVVSFPTPPRRNTAVGSAPPTLSHFIGLFGSAAFST